MNERGAMMFCLCLIGCSLPSRLEERESCVQHTDCHDDIPVCGQDGICARTLDAPQALADQACEERSLADQPGRRRASLSEAQDRAGYCVECREYTDCPQSAGPRACWHGTCVAACLRHADCMHDGLLCDRYARLVEGRDTPDRGPGGEAMGACVPRDEAFFVLGGEASCGGGDGSRERPFCKLSVALDHLSALGRDRAKERRPARFTIGLLDSGLSYQIDTLRLPSGITDLSLYGPDEGRMAVLGRSYGRQDGVEVLEGQRLVLDRVLVADAMHGVVCRPGGAVWLRRAALVNHDKEGLQAEGCEVQVDRTRIESNRDGALRLRGASRFAVRSSVIAHNSASDAPLIELDGPAEGEFLLNTVSNNAPGFSLGLYCRPGAGRKRVEASLLVYNRPEGAARHQALGCPLSQVVVDDGSPLGTPGAPEFVAPHQGGSYQLLDTPRSRQCCIEQLAQAPPSPLDEDFAGQRRVPGGRFDIGAYGAR